MNPTQGAAEFIANLEEKTGGVVKWIIPCEINEENINANPSA